MHRPANELYEAGARGSERIVRQVEGDDADDANPNIRGGCQPEQTENGIGYDGQPEAKQEEVDGEDDQALGGGAHREAWHLAGVRREVEHRPGSCKRDIHDQCFDSGQALASWWPT